MPIPECSQSKISSTSLSQVKVASPALEARFSAPLQSSRIYLLCLLVIGLLGFALVLAAPLLLTASLLLSAFWGLTIGYCLWRCRQQGAVQLLVCHADGWSLVERRGMQNGIGENIGNITKSDVGNQPVWKLKGDYSLHPHVISLRFQAVSQSTLWPSQRWLLIFPDAMDAESRRRLRTLLIADRDSF